MKTKGMLFSPAMVRAIMDGSKTMTRREIKPQPVVDSDSGRTFIKDHAVSFDIHTWKYDIIEFAPFKTGDIIYVRETYYAYGYWIKDGLTKGGKQAHTFMELPDHGYKYEENPPTEIIPGFKNVEGWYKRPSLFMPKAAARIFLKVTDVKAERVQDISEADAIREGVEVNRDGSWHDYISPDRLWQDSAKASFQSLWLLINGQESWDANPFVWCYSFEKITKP
jgi:hypothetical protein